MDLNISLVRRCIRTNVAVEVVKFECAGVPVGRLFCFETDKSGLKITWISGHVAGKCELVRGTPC